MKAMLFDFGGTLYDYATLAGAERETLLELAGWADVSVAPAEIARAYQAALRRVFAEYQVRPFYLYRDLFRDAVSGMLEGMGATVDDAHLERFRAAQWARHARDFTLRDGVVETLGALRDRGLQLGLVSNIDDDQLDHLMACAGLRSAFDWILTSEQAASCKPHAAIFAEALRRVGCPPEEVLFVGDTLAQDIAGANRAGMRSVLLWHREDKPPPEDGVQAHHVVRTIPEVLMLVG